MHLDPAELAATLQFVDQWSPQAAYYTLGRQGHPQLARLDLSPDVDLEHVEGWLLENLALDLDANGQGSIRLTAYGPKGGYLNSCSLHPTDDPGQGDQLVETPSPWHDAPASSPFETEAALHAVQTAHEAVARREAAVFARALGLLDTMTTMLKAKDDTIEALTVSHFNARERELELAHQRQNEEETGDLADRVVEKISSTALTLAAGSQGVPPELLDMAQRNPHLLPLLRDERVRSVLSDPEQVAGLLDMLQPPEAV